MKKVKKVKSEDVYQELNNLLIEGQENWDTLLPELSKQANADLELQGFMYNWHQKTSELLRKLPQKSYLVRFLNPQGIRYPLSLEQEYSEELVTHDRFQACLRELAAIVIEIESEKNQNTSSNTPSLESIKDTDKPYYTIIHNGHSREVILKVLDEQIVITKTRLNSPPDNFIDFLVSNPNKVIITKEIRKYIGNRKVHHLLRDLKFTGKLKEMFFPSVSKTGILFVNPITTSYLQKHAITPLNLKILAAEIDYVNGNEQ